MTRREIMKYCSVAGGAILVSTKGPLPQLFADTPQSPGTTPFLDELPRPPAPISTLAPFPDLTPESRAFIDPTGKKGLARFYKIVAEERSVKFHQNLPPTDIWGYRDANVPATDLALGPTFQERFQSNQFSAAIVRFQNRLNPNAQGFGTPRLSTHLHGGHHPFHADGFPAGIMLNGKRFNPIIEPGGHYDYTFPLVDPGFVSGQADKSDRPSTLWYHDHIIDFTGANVYRGLAGFFQVFDTPGDGPDIGNEYDPAGLRLPSGEFDIPLVLQDKIFAPDGSLVFDPFNHDGILGDKFLVNGKIQPFARVKRRRYRLRFLNGSNARFYQIFLTNSAGKAFPMKIIATEGGLLSHAQQPVTNFLISPAERFEAIVDFSMFAENEEVFIENRLAQDEGRGPKGTFEEPELLPSGTRILKFIVGKTVADPSVDLQPGMALRPFPAISQAELNQVTTFREFDFDRRHGAWVINGKLAGDLSMPVAQPVINKPEIWRLKNSSGGWWHPIHIHSEFHRVLSRNGRSPSPYVFERDGIARKDTTILGPGSEVEIYLQFRDYCGPFVFHCHNIEHEDMAMMARFDIQPVTGTPSF